VRTCERQGEKERRREMKRQHKGEVGGLRGRAIERQGSRVCVRERERAR
jgi:hypothetical protein